MVLQEYESGDWGHTSHGEAFGGGSPAELTLEGVPPTAFAGEAGKHLSSTTEYWHVHGSIGLLQERCRKSIRLDNRSDMAITFLVGLCR